MSVETRAILLRERLESRLDDVYKIIELNKNVIEIATNELTSINSQLAQMQRGGGVSGTIRNKLQSLARIADNPEILKQQSIISEQVIVLYVGAMESYLGDVIRIVGNEKPELFHLSDEKEMISFSQAMLKDGFKLGDAILEHIINKKFSFQDLKSSLDVFEKYLSIAVVLEEDQRDILILTAAARNVIVHHSSKVDRQFLKQVRDTAYSTWFNVGDDIQVSEEMIQLSKDAILGYADQITAAIIVNSQET